MTPRLRTTASALLGAVVLALTATGCTNLLVGNPLAIPGAVPVNSAESATVALTVPLELRPVLQVAVCGSAGAVPDQQGVSCYQLGQPFLVIHQLDAIDVFQNVVTTNWTIDLKLIPTDAQAVFRWTGANLQKQLAFVVGNVVEATPTVDSQVTDDDMQISGPFSEAQANQLEKLLSGR